MKRIFNLSKRVVKIIGSLIVSILIIIAILALISPFFEKKYSGPKYESDLYYLIDDYSTSWGKKNKCDVLKVGNFDRDHYKFPFGVWLRCDAEDNLIQGRARATQFVHDFYAMLQENEIVNEYLSENTKIYKTGVYAKRDLNSIGVKIAYWDKNVNRPQKPSLAEITFLDGEFRYYEADPVNQALKLVHKESYDDAIRLSSK